jgi:chromosome segregation ATPase
MNQYKTQLAAADLLKRERELDSRAADLDSRERIIGELPSEKLVEALQKQIDARQKVLDSVVSATAKERDVLIAIKEEAEAVVKAQRKDEATHKAHITELKSRASEASRLNDDKKHELEQINREIADAKRYYREEKTKVEEAINDWNTQLQEFAHEIRLTGEEKVKLLQSIDQLTQHKEALESGIDALLGRTDQLNEKYDVAATNYRKSLKTIKDEIDASAESHSERLEKVQKGERELDIRQKGLDIRERAVDAREQDAERELKRLQSLSNLI